MTGKDVVILIRQKISEAEKSGGRLFTLTSLSALVDQIDVAASGDPAKTPAALVFTANHETALAKYRVRVDLMLEEFKSVIAVGQTALKSMFLLNGGAAVAVLAFAGHIATSSQSSSIQPLALPLACFVAGLLLITIASGLTYLAQRAYSRRHRKLGNRLNATIIFFGLLSVAAFAIGSWFAYFAIATFSQRYFAEFAFPDARSDFWFLN